MWKNTILLFFCLITCSYTHFLVGQVLYNETFDNPGEGVKGPQPTTLIAPSTAWTVSGDFGGLTASSDYLQTIVDGGEGYLEAQDTDASVCFESEPIDISGYPTVKITADVFDIGDHEASDFVDFFLIVDGNSELLADVEGLGSSSHSLVGDKPDDNDFEQVQFQAEASGNSLVLKICMKNNAGNENFRIDNVRVEAGGGPSNPPTTPNPHPKVMISEINYHPSSGTGAEFIEIYYEGAPTLSLASWELPELDFEFPNDAKITSQDYLVIARDADEFERVYGCKPHFEWGNKSLANGGQKIRILDNSGNEIDEVAYQTGSPWPSKASGKGSSLELVDLSRDNALAIFWKESLREGGTPGVMNQTTETFCPEATPGNGLGSFTLIDAKSDKPVPGFDPIPDGANIDFKKIGTFFVNFRYNSPDSPGSVDMKMERGKYKLQRTENYAPYALFGNNGPNYYYPNTAFMHMLLWGNAGPISLEATPYSGHGLTGSAGKTTQIQFTLSVGSFQLREAIRELQGSLSIIPNPSKGTTLITGKFLEEREPFQLNIVNALGQTVYETEVSHEFQHKANLSKLPDGLYFVKIKGQDFHHIERMLLQK